MILDLVDGEDNYHFIVRVIQTIDIVTGFTKVSGCPSDL